MMKQPLLTLAIVRLVLDTGERLPCLVDAQTWLPLRLPMRWAVRYRRYRLQSSTLAGNLHILAKVYKWAWQVANIDLDNYLTSDRRLDARQIESLAAYLRESGITDGGTNGGAIVTPTTFNQQLSVVENFLTWALYPANRGGASALTFEQLSAERDRLKFLFQSLHMRTGQSRRHEPLTADEIAKIRVTIEPYEESTGAWRFPADGFSSGTALRNWLMFEMALELGLRRGELLKVRLDSLPRGPETGIKILRYPDDPHDSRQVEPAVKTAERILPASHRLLQAIRAYMTLPPPLGRMKGKSPYLFVTRTGNPLAIDTARDIIQVIGERSGVNPLSWHRLRHTWAERLAVVLLEQPNGLDRLMYLGGWTHPGSPKRYIQQAVAQQAGQTLRDYQSQLYAAGEEVAANDI
jgi:integrase